MGGEGSGRKPDPTNQLLNYNPEPIPQGTELFAGIPNVSPVKDGAGRLKGDASLLTNVPAGSESDPIWTAQSGAFLKTADLAANETDPIWNAQSGTYTLKATHDSLSSNFDTLSGAHASLSSNFDTLSGAEASLSSNFDTLSGAHTSLSSNFDTLSGAHTSLSSNFDTLSGAYATHAADASDPHGETLTQTNIAYTACSGATLQVTGDHTSSGALRVVNVLIGTAATPLTASNFPQGTIYLQYTA